MSTQPTTAERSRRVIHVSPVFDRQAAYTIAVWRAVQESLALALSNSDDVTEAIPTIAINGGTWLVTLDVLAPMTDSEKSTAGDAVLSAYIDEGNSVAKINREAICEHVTPTDQPTAYITAHAELLAKVLAAYAGEVKAGSCPVETLAAHLQNTGAKGVELAAVISSDAEYSTNPALVLFDAETPGLAAFPYFLALALWHDEIQPRAEAGPPNPRRVIVSGDDYWKIPKVMSATAWSIAGMANIDGNEYANATGATRYLPRAYAVAPHAKRPHQQTLQLEFNEPDDNVSMMMRTVNDTQALVNVDAGKLAALFMATGDKFNKLPLGELTKLITPTGQRVRKRDRESVTRSLHAISTLGLVLPDDTGIRLFDVRAPNNPTQTTPDQVVAWAYTQTFKDALASLKGSEHKALNWLNGEFIINFTALMNFTGIQGVEMRTYLALCSIFNDSMNENTKRYEARYAPKYTLEQLAAQTNSLSQNAVDLIREGKTTRSRSASKSRDLKKVSETLDYLESEGLVVLEGTPKEMKLIAPGEWQEAHNEFRKGWARTDYDK